MLRSFVFLGLIILCMIIGSRQFYTALIGSKHDTNLSVAARSFNAVNFSHAKVTPPPPPKIPSVPRVCALVPIGTFKRLGQFCHCLTLSPCLSSLGVMVVSFS